MNGAAARVPKEETSWNNREAKYAVVIIGIDSNSTGKAGITKWAKEYWSALQPYSLGGAYINFIMDEGSDVVKANYGDHYNRLAEIKAKYDPENVFKINQNIKPFTDTL